MQLVECVNLQEGNESEPGLRKASFILAGVIGENLPLQQCAVRAVMPSLPNHSEKDPGLHWTMLSASHRCCRYPQKITSRKRHS